MAGTELTGDPHSPISCRRRGGVAQSVEGERAAAGRRLGEGRDSWRRWRVLGWGGGGGGGEGYGSARCLLAWMSLEVFIEFESSVLSLLGLSKGSKVAEGMQQHRISLLPPPHVPLIASSAYCLPFALTEWALKCPEKSRVLPCHDRYWVKKKVWMSLREWCSADFFLRFFILFFFFVSWYCLILCLCLPVYLSIYLCHMHSLLGSVLTVKETWVVYGNEQRLKILLHQKIRQQS